MRGLRVTNDMNEGIIDIIKLILAGVLFFVGAVLLLAFIVWGATVSVIAGGMDREAITYLAAVFKSLKVVLALSVPGAMIYVGVLLLK